MLKFVIFLMFFLVASISVFSADRFNKDFAPDRGIIYDLEAPYREEICLNGYWDFQGSKEDFTLNSQSWDKTKIKIPSPWNVNSFSQGNGGDFIAYPSYPKEWEDFDYGYMKKNFILPESWKDKEVFIIFRGIAGGFNLYVNGKEAGSGFDNFMPFKFNITEFTKQDSNEIIVKVKKTSLFNKQGKHGYFTYPTGSFWGLHIAGIWQDVFVVATPKTYVSNIYIVPDTTQKAVSIQASITNNSQKPVNINTGGDIFNWNIGLNNTYTPNTGGTPDFDKIAGVIPVTKTTVLAGETKTISLTVNAEKLQTWELNNPKLYFATLKISSNNKVIDIACERFGYRDFKINGNEILLNGKPIELRGDSWHFMGIPQMTRRYAYAWYTALKDANANAVRLHAQPFPEFYLDIADEMGIAVLDESAIWASHCAFNYEEDETWERFNSHIEKLVMRDRNHPSVFGWSIENEVNAAMGVSGQIGEARDNVIKKTAHLADIVRKLDPSRDFISGDGCEDLDGNLPVNMLHYGDNSYYKRIAEKGKPWGVGEASAAYYGTPKELSRWNGDDSYNSFEGRMEALAYECYDLIANGQRANNANYLSVFNIAWYALKPLPLGLPDTTKAPTLKDGIFFNDYKEGKIGVQPERLGPYTTTFNPGYDSNLPLYEPWAMYEAIADAYTPDAPKQGKWSQKPDFKLKEYPNGTIKEVNFMGDKMGNLYTALNYSGWKINSGKETELLIIDGEYLNNNNLSEVKNTVEKVTKQGGTAVIWGFNKSNLETINKLLPYPSTATERVASSLVSDYFNSSDLYFTESPSEPNIMKYGIGGEILSKGKIIISPCNTDWDRWNFKGENIKTAATVRSEQEAKADGAAMVSTEYNNGTLILTSLDTKISNKDRQKFFANIGKYLNVEISNVTEDSGKVCDIFGNINKIFASQKFVATSYQEAVSATFINPKDFNSADTNWKELSVASDGMFDFEYLGTGGAGAVYLSLWLHSPQALDELLSNPNVPKISLSMGSDDGFKTYLNGDLIAENAEIHPCIPDSFKTAPLAVRKGWNHFLIKIEQDAGRWQFTGRFIYNDPDFWKTVTFSLEDPTKTK